MELVSIFALGASLVGWVAVLAWTRTQKRATRTPAKPEETVDRKEKQRLTDLEARVDELELVLKRIDNRVRMRAVRLARDDKEQAPDPHKDPTGWKAYMRAQRLKGGTPSDDES